MRKVSKDVAAAFMLREKRSIGNTRTDGETLFLHGNAIAQWRADGLYITLAGWPTVTTRDRLNAIDGVRVHADRGRQYLNGSRWSGRWVRVASFSGDVSDAADAKTEKIRKGIAAYAKLYSDGNIPAPSAGDCWYCALRTDKGESMGDALKDNGEHIREHIRERYVVGSLAVNAMREAGYKDAGIAIMLSGNGMGWNVSRCVRRYITRRLLPTLSR